MPRAFTLEITGLREMADKVKRLSESLDDPDKLSPMFLAGAQVIRDRAKAIAPRRTGLLADNIFAGKRRTKAPSAVVGIRRKKVPYCWFVEYGTPKMAAQPFMRPAAQGAAGEVLQKAYDVGRGIVEDMLK